MRLSMSQRRGRFAYCAVLRRKAYGIVEYGQVTEIATKAEKAITRWRATPQRRIITDAITIGYGGSETKGVPWASNPGGEMREKFTKSSGEE